MMRISTLLLFLVSLTDANQETLIGITGKDFVLLGADSSISSGGSISWTAKVDKISVFGTSATAAAGDAADTDRLVGMLRAHSNIRDYEASVGSDVEYMGGEEEEPSHGLSVDEVAHLARYQIAQSLRSRAQLNVCLLIAGMSPSEEEDDEGDHFTKRLQHQVQQATNQPEPTSSFAVTKSLLQPRLFWIDQYGSMQKLKYGAHGYAANFLLSVLDQGYRENLSKEEAIDLMKTCFEQLRVRYIIHSPLPPCIKCIDQEGCRLV